MTLDCGLTTVVKGHFSFCASNGNGLSTGEIVEIFHGLLHKGVLLLPCTVAGVIRCFLLVQRLHHAEKGLIQGHFGNVEAADEQVGREPLYNIQNSLVGASAHQNALAVLLDQ